MLLIRDIIIFSALAAVSAAGWWLGDHTAIRWLCAYFAVGFLCTAVAYAADLHAVWGKRANGTISPISWLLLGGMHLIHWIVLTVELVFQKADTRHLIAPNVWLGRRLSKGEEKTFGAQPVAVLDLTSEYPENPRLRTGDYLCIPLLDRRAPTPEQMTRAIDFINAHAPKQPVYIHCARGRGRSAAVAAAWLISNQLAPDVETAIASLRKIRPVVLLEPCQRALLTKMYPTK